MNTLKPNDLRARNVVVMITIGLIFKIIELISGYMQYSLLTRMASGGAFSMDEANANDLRQQAVAIIYLIVFVGSAITFILWFRRAYYNLHQKVEILTYEEGWATGAWFVPVLNWFRPYQIMKELYVETRHLLVQKGLISEGSLNTGILGWWWGFWVVSSISGYIVFRLSLAAKSVDELISTTMVSMIVDIISIPLAVLAIKVIRNYADVEPLLYEMPEEDDMVSLDGMEPATT